ncbi:MAG: hypothetical protein WBB46_03670 [Candidatus Deferrimicrobiaceae bacterium]
MRTFAERNLSEIGEGDRPFAEGCTGNAMGAGGREVVRRAMVG